MEIAFVDEANVADLYGSITTPWAWFPEGVTIKRIFTCEFFAENIVLHEEDR